MWKPSQTGSINHQPHARNRRAPRRRRRVPRPASRAQRRNGEQATIGKGLFIKGEIAGSESLYIDGKVEGSINLPGNRVTVGPQRPGGAPTSPRARSWCWARCAATCRPQTAWIFAPKAR